MLTLDRVQILGASLSQALSNLSYHTTHHLLFLIFVYTKLVLFEPAFCLELHGTIFYSFIRGAAPRVKNGGVICKEDYIA